jgi:hypothetical protein
MTPSKLKFSVTAGNPTDNELAAIELALANHKREELKPVVKRSVWAMPLMRTQLPQAVKFGSGRNI